MPHRPSWHEAAIHELRSILASDPDVLALAVVGSGAGGQLDAWSDLDALVVVHESAQGRYFPTLAWLAPLGDVYASEQHRDDVRALSRVCFTDMRRLDLIVATDVALAEPANWPRLPLAGGVRPIFARSPLLDPILAQPPAAPGVHPLTPAAFEAMANQFWFKGTVAVQKVVRDDLLIAFHLTLDLVRDCCVLAMGLRDRRAGTTIHHRAGGQADLAALASLRVPPTALGILDGIARSGVVFDALTREWSPTYRDRRGPLLAWIETARHELRDESRS